MSEHNLNEMTVIELRKLAKEMHVPLRAGISKQGIIERLQEALDAAPAPAEAPKPVPAEVPVPAEAPAAPAQPAEKLAERPAQDTPAPGFRQSTPPAAPRFNTKPAYQAPSYGNRNIPARNADAPRTTTTRPVGFTPRFGPAAAAQEPATREEERPVRTESPRPAYAHERRPAFNEPVRPQPRPAAEAPVRPAFESRPAYESRPVQEHRPAPEQRPAPAASEMLSPSECPEGAGVLELHPDGYGFLRSESLLPAAKDIFVAASQVKRFGLRAGDHIVGRIRPRRDGDKYSAMLYLTSINGVAPDAAANRPAFDELAAIYPRRRIVLRSPDGNTPDALRLTDMVAPIGFGQRALILCPPKAGHRSLLTQLAAAVKASHPTAQLTALLFNETPEEVTEFRESFPCPVLTSTFDMPPEHHLRMAELAVEAAARQVEMKRDVVLLVDDLTALAHIVTSSSLQQGRQAPGAFSPASVQKAKRLFGSARCLREGGSLTVIAVMHTGPANKADEPLIAEFRAAANMTLLLDAELAKKGVSPAIDLNATVTKRAELLQSPAEQEALTLIRAALETVPCEKAVPALAALPSDATGDALTALIRTWADEVR